MERPLRPVARPPDDIEKSYLPSGDLLIVTGRRLETNRSLDSSRGGGAEVSSAAGILCEVFAKAK